MTRVTCLTALCCQAFALGAQLPNNVPVLPGHYDFIIPARGRWFLTGNADSSVVLDQRGKPAFSLIEPADDQKRGDGLFPVIWQGLSGLLDSAGRLLVPPKYASIGPFAGGWAKCQTANGWGIIERDGVEKVAPQYDEIETLAEHRWSWGTEEPPAFYRNLILLKKGGKFGLVRRDQLRAVPAEYRSVGLFSEGMAAIETDKKFGFIDTAGRVVVAPEYDMVQSFSQGLAMVRSGQLHGMIDRTGRLVVPIRYKYIRDVYEGKRQAILPDGSCDYLMVSGSVQPPRSNDEDRPPTILDEPAPEAMPSYLEALLKQYDYSGKFNEEGLAPVRKNGIWGLVDTNGRELFRFACEELGTVGNHRAAYKQNGKWGLIDLNGNPLTPAIYHEFRSFSDGVASVWRNGKWGAIDRAGREIIEPAYDDELRFQEGISTIQVEKKYGLVNRSGKILVQPQYGYAFTDTEKRKNIYGFIRKPGSDATNIYLFVREDGFASAEYSWIYDFLNGYAVVRRDSLYNLALWGVMDSGGQEVIAVSENYVRHYSDTLFCVESRGISVRQSWLADTRGQVLKNTAYDFIYGLEEGFSRVRRADKFGFIDARGAVVQPPQYDSIGEFKAGFAFVRQNGRLGLLNRNRQEVLVPEYDRIQPLPDGWFALRQGNRCSFARSNGMRLDLWNPEPAPSAAEENGWLRIARDGKWGWVDAAGQLKIACRFDAVTPFREGRAWVMQLPYSKAFCIDETGAALLGW